MSVKNSFCFHDAGLSLRIRYLDFNLSKFTITCSITWFSFESKSDDLVVQETFASILLFFTYLFYLFYLFSQLARVHFSSTTWHSHFSAIFCDFLVIPSFFSGNFPRILVLRFLIFLTSQKKAPRKTLLESKHNFTLENLISSLCLFSLLSLTAVE